MVWVLKSNSNPQIYTKKEGDPKAQCLLNKLHGHMPETPALGKLRPEDQKSGASFLDLTPKTLILKKNDTGAGTQWNSCLACSKPWVRFSPPHKHGVQE